MPQELSELAKKAISAGIWSTRYDGLWLVGTDNKQFYDKLCKCTVEELFHDSENEALEHAARVLGL